MGILSGPSINAQRVPTCRNGLNDSGSYSTYQPLVRGSLHRDHTVSPTYRTHCESQEYSGSEPSPRSHGPRRELLVSIDVRLVRPRYDVYIVQPPIQLLRTL